MSRPQNEMEMMQESNDELSHDHELGVRTNESQHHHEEYNLDYWNNNSTSSLSGGFTTITNLDATVDGNGNQNAGSPSRSVFQFMGGMDSPHPHATTSSSNNSNNNNDNGSHALGSFQSYYEMQRDGPYILDTDIRQDQMLKHQDSSYVDAAEDGIRRHHRASHFDPDDGGFCDQAECTNVDIISDVSTEGKHSSLSSITNDFFPKFNGKGRFLNYGHKKKLSSKSTRGATTINTTSDSKASPPSSNENNASSSQSERRLSSISQSKKKLFTGSTSINNSKRKKNNLVTGSPWYHVSGIQLQPHHYLESHGNNHHHPQIEAVDHWQLHQQNPGINREQQVPTRAPPPDSIIIRPPKEVLIAHHNKGQHFEDLGFTPSQTPSVISSDFSQFFTNELRERYRRSNMSIHRSYRHRYNQFIGNSSRSKKIFVVSLSLVFLLGLIAIATLTMGSRRRNDDQGKGIDGAVTVEYGDLSLPNRDGLPEACCMKGYDGLDALPPDEEEDGALYENNSLDNDGGEEDELDDVEDDKKASLNELGSLTVGIQTAVTTAPSPKPITPTTSTIASSSSTGATTAAASHELTETPPEEMQFAKDQINVADWVQAFATTGQPTTGSPTTRMPVPSPPTTMAPVSSSPTTSKPTTKMPSRQPSSEPTKAEFMYSTSSTSIQAVTWRPTELPSNFPSPQPTREPWAKPHPVTRQPTIQPSRKPTWKPTPVGQGQAAPRPVPNPVKVTPQSSLVRIKSIDATINESRPNRNYGAEEFLSIKGNTKVAIIRFDIGPLQGYAVGKATLRLFTAFDEDSTADEDITADKEVAGSGPIKIKVDLLPRSGTWNEDSVSWSNGIKMSGSLRAGTFTAREVGSKDEKKKKHEVDVTSVIANLLSPLVKQAGQQPNPAKVKRNGRFYVTFRLSSDSGRRISFASREWRGGLAEPQLSVMLASDSGQSNAPTQSPTSHSESPTPPPSARPSQEPNKAPVTTELPTSSPVRSPSFRPSTKPTGRPSLRPSTKPTMAPTKAPEAATTTSTTSTTTTTIFFAQCPQKFIQSSDYKYINRMKVSHPSPMRKSIHGVYRCEGGRCNGNNNVPGSLASDWTLVGSCPTSTLTTTTSTTATSSTTAVLITNKPSSSPSRTPSLKPSPSPTNVKTSTPTFKPSPSPTVKPSPIPIETESPTAKPTSTPEPTPVPTPSPTPLPTIEPTPHPVTPEPTQLPTPNPVTPEPSPEPSPPPSPGPSPPPSTELFK